MSIILRKAEKTTTLGDLQDRLQQVEDGGDLLASLYTQTLATGVEVNVAAFTEGAATPPLGTLELFAEPAHLSPEAEAAFYRTVEADGSKFVAASDIFIEGVLTRVVACRRPVTAGPPAPAPDHGHGSNNPHAKPAVITTFRSPNHSARNGVKIQAVVLHCAELDRESTIRTFLNPGGRQVSAHYVIDRDGDIFQMVSDTDRANHCKGANAQTIGIEHTGGETDAMAPEQQASSVALLRWLMEQYDIPAAHIYGHDFMPGRETGTSCPDRLFGPGHTQAEIAAWVQANVVAGA